MTIKIYYTTLANQFFFISNLAEWHFSCRKAYNETWLKNNPLSNEEKDAIKRFRKVLMKYGFSVRNNENVYLGIPFIASSSAETWQKVSEWVNKQDYQEIKNVFEIFNPRFNKEWLNTEEQLKLAKKELDKTLKNENVNCVLNIISSLYKTKLKKKIDIYLLASPMTNGSGGNANLGPKNISIEVPAYINSETISQVLLVIFHEMAHLIEKQNFRPFLLNWIKGLKEQERLEIEQFEVYKTTKNIFTIIDEMIVSSLLPEGYLSEIITGQDSRIKNKTYLINGTDNLLSLRHFAALHLYHLVREYVGKKKSLDAAYIQKTYQILKEFGKLP